MALFGSSMHMGGWQPFKPSTWSKPVAQHPLETFRGTDPGVGAINQSPAAQTFMQAALPIAGGYFGGPAGSAGGAYLGQRLFGPGDESERKRRGVKAGVMAGGTHMAGQGIYDYYGGGPAPSGGTPSAGMTPDEYLASQQAGQMASAPATTPSYQLTEPSPSLGYTSGEMAAPPPTQPTTPYTLSEPTLAPAPYAGPAGVGADMMLTPPPTRGGMIAPPGQGPGATPYAYMGGPGSYTGTPSYPAYSTNVPATGGGGFDWGGMAKRWGPLMGLQAFSTWQQKEMAEDYQEAQRKSYEDYLKTINVPEDVKETRFEALKSGILKAAPAARKRRASQMAARGIRGKGAAAPIAETESDIQSAIDQARLSVYGQYNVPGAPPPVSYTPSTGQMIGQSATDLGTILAMYNLYGGGGRRY